VRCLSLPLAPSREDNPSERGLFWAIGCSGAHIQEEEFAEEEGVVDPFLDFVITQAVPGLKQ